MRAKGSGAASCWAAEGVVVEGVLACEEEVRGSYCGRKSQYLEEEDKGRARAYLRQCGLAEQPHARFEPVDHGIFEPRERVLDAEGVEVLVKSLVLRDVEELMEESESVLLSGNEIREIRRTS